MKPILAVLMGVLIAFAGFCGGLVSHAVFPAATGHVGHTGARGASGPTGATGSAASVNLGALGLCVSYVYGSPIYITAVASPTLTNGTQSCDAGLFIPVAAQP